MVWLRSLAPVALFATVAVATAAGAPRVFTLEAERLVAIRTRVAAGAPELQPALEAVRARAEAALAAPLVHVAQKPREVWPVSGDPRDYVSSPRFSWPDPSNPGGPWLNRDGVPNEEMARLFDGPRRVIMQDRVQALAWGWWYGRDLRYAEAAAEQMRAWFTDPETGMNPHLEFAQSIPFSGRSNRWGVIDANAFPKLLDAVGLIADSGVWTEEDDLALRDWFDRFTRWLTESELGRQVAENRNNHGTFYDLLVATGAEYAGNHALARRILAEVGPKRLDHQIKADGSMPEETRRAESVMYTLWNLNGLMDLAVVAARHEIDLWHYPAADDPALRRAGDYLLSYVNGERSWTHGRQTLQPWSPVAYFWRAGEAYGDERFYAALRYLGLSEERRMEWEASSLWLQWLRVE